MCFAKQASAPTNPAAYALDKSETAVDQTVATTTGQIIKPQPASPAAPKALRTGSGTGLFNPGM